MADLGAPFANLQKWPIFMAELQKAQKILIANACQMFA